jgi:hypothetical protein
MLLHDMLQPLPQPLNLEALRDPAHQRNRVDGGADLLEQGADEARLVHAVLEQVVPEVRVVLLLGKGDGAPDVAEAVDDQVEGALGLAGFGVEVDELGDVVVVFAFLGGLWGEC